MVNFRSISCVILRRKTRLVFTSGIEDRVHYWPSCGVIFLEINYERRARTPRMTSDFTWLKWWNKEDSPTAWIILRYSLLVSAGAIWIDHTFCALWGPRINSKRPRLENVRLPSPVVSALIQQLPHFGTWGLALSHNKLRIRSEIISTVESTKGFQKVYIWISTCCSETHSAILLWT